MSQSGPAPGIVDPRLIELGRAETVGQILPLGRTDPVPAARAVRRALAAARRHAIDVEMLLVVADDRLPDDDLRRLARRALGPHGTAVRVGWVGPSSVAGSSPDMVRPLDLASGAVGVILVVGRDGTCLARCLGHSPLRLP